MGAVELLQELEQTGKLNQAIRHGIISPAVKKKYDIFNLYNDELERGATIMVAMQFTADFHKVDVSYVKQVRRFFKG